MKNIEGEYTRAHEEFELGFYIVGAILFFIVIKIIEKYGLADWDDDETD